MRMTFFKAVSKLGFKATGVYKNTYLGIDVSKTSLASSSMESREVMNCLAP